MESLEVSWPVSSSSESEAAQESDGANNAEGEDIDVGNRKGADILLNIHDHLDLDRLQKVLFYLGVTSLRYWLKLNVNRF